MMPTTKHQWACCYCGDSFASGEDVLRDSSQLFAEWEVIRHELVFPYHRVCWCWDRIDRWLSTNAPLVFRQLANGATDEEIDLTERRLQTRFPSDLRRSYRIHNGSGKAWLFDGGTFLSLRQVRSIADLAVNWESRPAEAAWDHIPIMARVGGWEYCGGSYYGVDCNQVMSERHGQVIWLYRPAEAGEREVISSGFQHYLEEFAGYLERGHYVEKDYKDFVALEPCNR